MKRASGVLMHISSLPNKYGIGSFGKEAVEFSRVLKEMGMKYWQTLPFSIIDDCNSPYKSVSAFGGNPLFIDLETLYEKGLLTIEELKDEEYTYPYKVDYERLKPRRMKVLRKAFERLDEEEKKKIEVFYEENKYWLEDMSLYMGIKASFEDKEWTEWDNSGLVKHNNLSIKSFAKKNQEEINFNIFLQYEFFTQWKKIKEEINENGIEIIGDIPIYVSLESVDVWANKKLFQLTQDNRPKFISGVPPDYFSSEGQMWGNPLYNWKEMGKNNYDWWIERINKNLEIFDVVKIDHFRGFSDYWSIPADALTAKEGSWEEGPKMKLFNEVLKNIDSSRIIAEDLGEIDDEVRNLLEETKFPGMRVMQFAFMSDGNSIHLPHNYEKNTVAYTGTHDNNTTIGWIWEIGEDEKRRTMEYLSLGEDTWGIGGPTSDTCRKFFRSLWGSVANLTIVPIQDLLGYGSDTKMNKPGEAKGNWEYRVTKEDIGKIDKGYIRNLNRIYRR